MRSKFNICAIGLWSSFVMRGNWNCSLTMKRMPSMVMMHSIVQAQLQRQWLWNWSASWETGWDVADGSQDSTHDQNHWHLTAPTGSTADGVAAAVAPAAATAAASATTSAICNYLFMPALTLALGISKLPTQWLVAGCRKLCRPRCLATPYHASLGVSYAMTNQYTCDIRGGCGQMIQQIALDAKKIKKKMARPSRPTGST